MICVYINLHINKIISGHQKVNLERGKKKKRQNTDKKISQQKRQ